MYQGTSDLFNSMIVKSGRTFHARILLGESVLEGFSSIKTTSGSNDSGAITLGNAIAQSIQVEMDKPEVTLSGQEFELQMGLVLDDETTEYVPIGLFTPEKITEKDKKISFTAYDRMMKLSPEYISNLPDETDTISVLEEIEEITGVPISTSGLTAIAMRKPTGYTCRETLMYIAQLYGCFANVNRAGTIEFHFWEDSGYILTADSGIKGFSCGESSFTVEMLTVTGIDDNGNMATLTAGEGDDGISFSNPFMTQNLVDAIYEEIGGFTYTPVECPVNLGDIRLDPWDLITVVDASENEYKVPLMSLSYSYDGGLSCTIKSTVAAESEKTSDYKGPIERLKENLESKIEDFTGKIQTQVTQNTEQIELKASKEEVENIQIGARNLIRNSVNLIYADYYFSSDARFTYILDESGNYLLDESGNLLVI